MANYLASIYGTEQDKVNCSFYFKIGACRHGDKCSRKHVKPQYSQTILMPNLYMPPAAVPGSRVSPEEQQRFFEDFYDDIYVESATKFGVVEEMIVCENSNEHLTGNVYVRFKYEEDAQKALDSYNSRWYGGKPIYCELSPVTDFREACCRQHETQDCNRGGLCNFIHAKRPPKKLLRDLELAQKKMLLNKGVDPDQERSPSPPLPRRR